LLTLILITVYSFLSLEFLGLFWKTLYASTHSSRLTMPKRDEDLAEEPPSSINPYKVLEVDEKATADQIKTAYRKKALKHHPGTQSICLPFR